jgi:hypothetical protein
MVVPLVSPSNLLSSNSALKIIEAQVGGGRICGSKFRREASGALTVQKLRLSPIPEQEQSLQTWFEADEALIQQDLSSIRGNGRVRLGLGANTVEGESFALLPEENLFLLSQVVFRSREPVLRVTANRLRAKYRLDSKTGGPVLETLELIGSVQGSIVLTWRDDARKFDVNAGRVAIDMTGSKTSITISGNRRQPASLKSRDGLIAMVCEHGVLKYGAGQINFEGQLVGTGRLSGASLFDSDERTQFHVTKASAFSITASLEEPLWWAGDANHCTFDRMIISKAECGDRPLGTILVLQDPGFARNPKDCKGN